MEMSRLTRDGTAGSVSRDQILRHERGQGNINFPCSADHVQDWQPYPVDPYSCCVCDHTKRAAHYICHRHLSNVAELLCRKKSLKQGVSRHNLSNTFHVVCR